jgi:hypothetical protein
MDLSMWSLFKCTSCNITGFSTFVHNLYLKYQRDTQGTNFVERPCYQASIVVWCSTSLQGDTIHNGSQVCDSGGQSYLLSLISVVFPVDR